MLCVFITSLLYHIPIGDQIDGLPLAAGAAFYTAIQIWPCYTPFSTYSPTRTWGVGSLSAQNVRKLHRDYDYDGRGVIRWVPMP